jgi:chromosome segregation ATPase
MDVVVHAASDQHDSCEELPCNKGYLQQLCREAQQGGGGIGVTGVQTLVFPPLIVSSSGIENSLFAPSIVIFPVPFGRVTREFDAQTPEAAHFAQLLASTSPTAGTTDNLQNSQLFVVFFGANSNSWEHDDLTIASLFASIMINAVLASRTQQSLAQLNAAFHLANQQFSQEIAEDRTVISRLQAVAEQQVSTIAAHESRVTEYQQIDADLQSLVSAKMQEIDALQRRNQEAAGALAASQTAHALQVTELNGCIERLQLQVATISELDSRLQQASQSNEQLHLQLQESDRTCTARALALAAKQAALNMAEIKVEELRSSLDSSSKQLAEVNEKYARVAGRDRKTRNDLEKTHSELKGKTMELHQLQAIVEDLSSSLNKADSVMSQSKAAFDKLTSELSALRTEVLHKDAQAQAVGSERDQLRRRCTNLEELVATHASESGQLQGMLTSMSGDLAALAADRDVLRYKVERLIDVSGPPYPARSL